MNVSATGYPRPQSEFSTDMATQCLNGNRFDFFNRTKLNGFGWVPKYYWDFGDGTHDYINTFTYGKTYTQAGTYTVSLVAESNYGCKDTNTLLVTVLPNGQCTPGLIRPTLNAKYNNEGAFDALEGKTEATGHQNTQSNYSTVQNLSPGTYNLLLLGPNQSTAHKSFVVIH